MATLCVYLGANAGHSTKYKKQAIKLGQQLASSGISLIYGGSSLGLMGELARSVLANGGNATGIITEHLLDIEKPLEGLDRLITVKSMSERKSMMIKQSDAFLVFPGGIGTLEEAIETLNAIKIGLINKKIGFLNIEGYFDSLFQFINECSAQGFIKAKDAGIALQSESIENLLATLFTEFSPSQP